MRPRIVVCLLALKIALLAPAASAMLGVVATQAEAAGVSAPVTKVPRAPVASPATTPDEDVDAAAPSDLATVHVEVDDRAADAQAEADDVPLTGVRIVDDRPLPLRFHARGEPAKVMRGGDLQMTVASRRVDAPFESGDDGLASDAAANDGTPVMGATDITVSGGDATQVASPPSTTAAEPRPVAAPGPSAPPARHPAGNDTAPFFAAAAATSAAFLALLASLYARLRGPSALASDKRARLVVLLREAPGMTMADAARALACDATTARHHLRTLIREGFAVAHEGRHFAAGDVPAHDREARVAASDAGRVLDAIRARPGASKQQLADALAVARATVSWHLRRLQQAGLVRSERDGRCVRVYATS